MRKLKENFAKLLALLKIWMPSAADAQRAPPQQELLGPCSKGCKYAPFGLIGTKAALQIHWGKVDAQADGDLVSDSVIL